jgi:diguanylate cyclase
MLLAVLSSFLGYSSWFYYTACLGREVPFPGSPVLFIYLYFFLYIVAIFYRLYMNRSNYKLWQILLDSSMVITVIASLGWMYVMQNLIEEGTMKLSNFALLSFPVLEMALLFCLLMLFFIPQRKFPSIALILNIVSMLLFILANTIYLYHYVHSDKQPFILYVLWAGSPLLIGISSLHDTNEYSYGNEKEDLANQPSFRLPQLLLPYIGFIALAVTLLMNINEMKSIIIGGTVCFIFMAIRQINTLLENKRLITTLSDTKEHLEKRVEQRTIELTVLNSELEYLAEHDSLTGLPNRLLFAKRLEQCLKSKIDNEYTFAVLFLDLDRFKSINDFFGHEIGDKLLIQIAKCIKDCTREYDTIARQSGDEFLIILDKVTDFDEIRSIANNIIATFQTSFVIDDYDINTSISIGIAVYPNHGDAPEALIKNADTAMYRAKEKGKNLVEFYDEDMGRGLSKKLLLEKCLYSALERNELELYYQPQFTMSTGELVGMEALLRWNHPELGIISPKEFITLAEETGLIIPIGEWVIREACNQAKKWHDNGALLKVGVNLSPRQFVQDDLVLLISNILKETGLNPNYLDLEIIENIALYNEEYVIEKLNLLKKLGVKISIDDFGTGYSSLSYMKRLSFDTIKIANPFIVQIEDASNDISIVSAIIALGKSLNVNVIAEGVETKLQWDILKKMECDEMQGYYMGKPVQVKLFEEQYLQQYMVKAISC